MEITALTREDWPRFTDLARAEGWRVPRRELELYGDPQLGAGYVLRVRSAVCGYVTVTFHQRSGWVGNLLVAPEVRGRGYGRRLFVQALDALRGRGCDPVWLTASQQGRRLYEQHGFSEVDGVERWARRSAGRLSASVQPAASASSVVALDRRTWEENRDRLLLRLAGTARCFCSGTSAAMLQDDGQVQILGPWLSQSACPRENRQLLAAILAAAEPGCELVTDVLACSPLRTLLAGAGFERVGGTRLMALGRCRPGLAGLVSLASLGSMG